MPSLRSILIGAVTSLALIGAVAPAAVASPVHGRGLHAEAEFYAGALGHRRAGIQILDQLCRNPERQRRCTPIKPALERAISRIADRPISWVSEPKTHGGVFWVLAPVRFGSDRARVRWAWRDLAPYGCFGGGTLTYGRAAGAWNLTTGIDYEGCPANPGSGAIA
jgi:hypothetical protein